LSGGSAAEPPAPRPAGTHPGGFLPPTVVALGAVSFLTDFASEMIYPLLPVFLTTTLGAGAVTLGVVEGAAESTAALLKLVSGWLSDRARRRKPLVVGGYALAALVRPLIGLAQAAWQVLAVRVADRVGKGLRTSPRDALIGDVADSGSRGRAFGFHRAADHAGALVGPLVAFALLHWVGLGPRSVFLWAAVPGALSVLVVVVWVREPATRSERRTADDGTARGENESGAVTWALLRRSAGLMPRPFWAYLAFLFLFTLGNSADAFLLLRAVRLGVAPEVVPLLWSLLHLVKSLASTPGGMLSDRWGRRGPIVAGWLLYAGVYLGFGLARQSWQVWTLFGVYGLFFALTEGAERAFVADLVPTARRGAAFGWFYLAVGVGALPASVLFGAAWHALGPLAAFALGAGLALVAAAGLLTVVPGAPAAR